MTDADRRKLIFLVEARATATSAAVVIQRLVANLEQLKDSSTHDDPHDPHDPLYAPTRVAKDLWSSLISIRERLDQQINEVPS